MATLRCSFEEILEGALGQEEALAAQRWLAAGAPLEPAPAGLAVQDASGLDMRVTGAPAGKRRRVILTAQQQAGARMGLLGTLR